jgi:hypothetical protein
VSMARQCLLNYFSSGDRSDLTLSPNAMSFNFNFLLHQHREFFCLLCVYVSFLCDVLFVHFVWSFFPDMNWGTCFWIGFTFIMKHVNHQIEKRLNGWCGKLRDKICGRTVDVDEE